MKLRLTIIILIITLSVGSLIIATGFISNSNYVDIPNISTQYDNLLKYKNELEKINQYNQKILNELENEIKNSDDVNINQINNEIEVLKQVINENKFELEQIITKLSEIETETPPLEENNFTSIVGFSGLYLFALSKRL